MSREPDSKKTIIRVNGGLSYIGALATLMLATLKIGDIGQVAKWSWWWVLSPLWGTVLVELAFLAIAVIVLAVFISCDRG